MGAIAPTLETELMMKKYAIPASALAALITLTYFAFRPDAQDAAEAEDTSDNLAIVDVAVPPEFSELAALGAVAFESACINCHGQNAEGKKGFGPPLVHKIYEPSHHADYAFLMAVENGVRSHHWPFGNMPPQEGFTQGDVKAIIAYVRELQRANGIN